MEQASRLTKLCFRIPCDVPGIPRKRWFVPSLSHFNVVTGGGVTSVRQPASSMLIYQVELASCVGSV